MLNTILNDFKSYPRCLEYSSQELQDFWDHTSVTDSDAEGMDVLGMDNLITGNMENLEDLMGHPKFTFNNDVSNFARSGRIGLHPPLYLTGLYRLLKDPDSNFESEFFRNAQPLRLALNKKARILVASTSEVYGDPLVHPQTEEYWGTNPVGPRGVYDEAKRFMEAMTMAYHTYHGLETHVHFQHLRS